MEEWAYAQAKLSERLARLHCFSVVKQQDGREIEFLITVKEYAAPGDRCMHFFVLADKENQSGFGAYTPCGWGETPLSALSDCLMELHRFPY